MNSIERQPVPLGGCRVPESMGGSNCPPWQELPEQKHQQSEGYGLACDTVLSLRDQIGLLKKQLSGIALPMKDYIYSTAPADRTAIEGCLTQIDSAALTISNAAKVAAEATAADPCLSSDLKAEAAKVLNAVRSDASQQAADCRALCLVIADKADEDSAKRQQQQQQEQPQPLLDRKEFDKELYGDFNLQLGPITRKMFAAQTKLLALIKSIKKQRTANSLEEETNN